LIALVDGEPAAAGKKRTYFLIGEGRESRIEVPIIALIEPRTLSVIALRANDNRVSRYR
jgi:hypothetical protein